ncbi:class II aldolase/adducin family protein [Limobrevibacterium gyesilva]|uniref:Class II aldolase/adducin family protein n=1 Tax=Limobrevibacterium gyesilva TaxID=2991712 RepID=A0AA41YR01_9PROT|nr:class II aldolase/adducin family protein [Limobrevibacterium gyesilva]MCW3475028.1 class II aldolase/adducin family protein [Limobrevibacterium gyesilva]
MTNISAITIPSVRSRVSPEEWQARVDLAACYRLIARYGWADLTATHTSVEVPGSDRQHFLINPHGMLFEQVTASSLVKIDCDGNPVMESPYRVNPAGFVIHSAIHMARADAICVMHTHSVAGIAVSMQAQGLLPASQHACFFHGNIGYHDIEHMEHGVEGRAALARDLGPHPALIMRNHGLLACGRTVAETFWLMHTLEKACAAQVAALAGGAALHPVSEQTASWFGDLVGNKDFSLKLGNTAWPSLLRLLDDTDPSYRD